MAKLAQSTIKYLIEADFSANGVVEKPDVIGAIFGQTEGLLGQDLDLRELQRTGRIGRIEVNLKEDKGTTSGTIQIPSSLDASETSLIAAAVETIERIGPCESSIKLRAIKDIRMVKRDYVVDRAKEILQKLLEEIPETDHLTETVKESVRISEIAEYNGLECGPDIPDSNEIIVVEGRADVINLLKNGIKNAVAVGGTTVSKELIDFCQDRIVTLFLDGDRGGDLILKELSQLIPIRDVVRAPDGKEVEELTKKEIYKALRTKNLVEKPRYKKREDLDERMKEKISNTLDRMIGTKAVYIFDDKMKIVGKIPLSRFTKENKDLENAKIVLVDSSIDDNMIEIADHNNISYLIGESLENKTKPKRVRTYTKTELNN